MASPLTFDLLILIFAFGLLEVSHISSSGLFDLVLLTENAYRAHRATTTKFKIDVTIHVAL